jgi:hypothetical protein
MAHSYLAALAIVQEVRVLPHVENEKRGVLRLGDDRVAVGRVDHLQMAVTIDKPRPAAAHVHSRELLKLHMRAT